MKSIQQIVEEQAYRWQRANIEFKPEQPRMPVITISREPGSGGKLVAQEVAKRLGFDLFHQEVIHEIAKSSQISSQLIKTLDEKGLNVLEESIATLVHQRHLWPDEYLKQLMKVIATIGKHGQAVIIGRGANFILPPENRFRVRIAAPRKFRAQHVANQYKISMDEALRRIIRTDSDRKAFIRKYFNADIADPLNYDIILNTGSMEIRDAATAICAVFESHR